MAELLLVNPSRKSRRRKKNPMPRGLARYWAKRRRRKNPERAANPSRRRRRKHVARARSRRRTNPSLRGAVAQLRTTGVGTLQQAAIGSIGALGNDLLMGQVLKLKLLPEWMTKGTGAAVLKAVGALGIGILGGYVWRGHGRDFGDGAMTVVLHDLLKSQVQSMFPDWSLGEYLTFAPTVGYSDAGLGEYLTGPGSGSLMGEYVTDIGNADYYGSNAAGMINSF